MYVKKIKRKCGVRGCKCIQTYAISLTREAGNSIIACKECLEKALEAIKNSSYAEDGTTTATAYPSPPPLFFHSRAVADMSKDTGNSVETDNVENKAHDTLENAEETSDKASEKPQANRAKGKKGAAK